ncbi:tetratricopeptide repeat protein [Pontiella agarivorans]|uniref:Tetratricopeptide repeat protein n=1 Tax=Pontiella agarivorans TaxID=3038953 RepID=A0ABU5MSJ0_9BACT|nr:tetratricopeptide repeat protein [Pontiella agarivorans]MDZ8117169.1 tetratricopeptide repeat protein [Pontiella agarivorans]
MEPEKRQHLQDIYATDTTQRDDYTPQVSQEMIAERNREIRRHQLVSFALGTAVLLLGVALVFVVVREYMEIISEAEAPAPITQEYIPRYSLPSESQWVMDFPSHYADPVWNGEGERPFNSAWVKKAAFNLILAEQAMEIGEFNKAATHYENALEILPDLDGVRVPLGMAYFQQKKYDEALALLEDASDADLTFDVLNNLGAACIEAKAYDKGEEYLIRALELRPAYPEALKNQAMLYREMGKEADAVSAYEKYLDLRPQDSNTRHSFALYLTKIGNWDLAAEQLYTLTEEIKKDATLYQLLARVEMRRENNKEAIAAFQRAAQLSDPNQALNYMNDEEFDRLRGDEDYQALMRSIEER